MFVLLAACDQVVDVSVNSVEPYLVVDAWLTHLAQDQKIRLTTTQPYYDNRFATGVTNAQVVVSDDRGTIFSFQDVGNGDYVYASPDTFGVVGRTYFLDINWNGHRYTAWSEVKRVPPIDSITFTYEEASAFSPAYYYSEFFGTDPVGEGDAYWLKVWKNGLFLNKPSEMYYFFDASFSQGNGDGYPFIFPIRTLANPFEMDINGNFIPYYGLQDTLEVRDGKVTINGSEVLLKADRLEVIVEGKETVGGVRSYPLNGLPYSSWSDGTTTYVVKAADSVYLELHAITPETWQFIYRVNQETNRIGGFGALFATPPANVPTNIVPDDESIRVAGFFAVSNVSARGRRLSPDAIRVQPF